MSVFLREAAGDSERKEQQLKSAPLSQDFSLLEGLTEVPALQRRHTKRGTLPPAAHGFF